MKLKVRKLRQKKKLNFEGHYGNIMGYCVEMNRAGGRTCLAGSSRWRALVMTAGRMRKGFLQITVSINKLPYCYESTQIYMWK